MAKSNLKPNNSYIIDNFGEGVHYNERNKKICSFNYHDICRLKNSQYHTKRCQSHKCKTFIVGNELVSNNIDNSIGSECNKFVSSMFQLFLFLWEDYTYKRFKKIDIAYDASATLYYGYKKKSKKWFIKYQIYYYNDITLNVLVSSINNIFYVKKNTNSSHFQRPNSDFQINNIDTALYQEVCHVDNLCNDKYKYNISEKSPKNL